jgi:hypothetical protein
MIDGDVTVNWPRKLVIQPPSKITFYANTDEMKTWDTTKCEFFVGGTLKAEGSAIDSIIFNSTVADTEVWRGIRFLDNADTAIFSFCRIENAYIGLDFGGHLDKYKLTNSVLRNNTYGIYHLWLFELPSTSEAKICDNYIYRDASLPRGLIGMYVLGGSADLQDVQIEDNVISNYNKGIYLDDCWQPGNLSLGSNNIQNVARGLVAEDCINLQLSHVIVSGDVDEFGYYFDESDVSMSYCKFEGDTTYNTPVGVCFHSESTYPRSLIMRYCKISNFSEKGIWSESHYHPEYVDLGTEQNHGINKIISNSGFLVYNGGRWKGSVDSVKAQYNWWGSYPPSSSRFSGRVKYMPALETEPWWPDDQNEKIAALYEIPKDIELSHNYPNPFNPATTIQFTIVSNSSHAYTTLKIYNILGQMVKTLVDEEKSEGTYTVFWDGRNDDGETVSSGIYFYKLQAGELTEVKKMVLLH